MTKEQEKAAEREAARVRGIEAALADYDKMMDTGRTFRAQLEATPGRFHRGAPERLTALLNDLQEVRGMIAKNLEESKR